jgi:hypothetical protein
VGPDLQFSSVQTVTDLQTGGFSLDFKDLSANIQAVTDTLTTGTGLQGATESEVLDLRDITGTVKANFTVNREAAYDDFVGFYKVDDPTGRIGTINPTDAGYVKAAMNARVAGIDLRVDNQGTGIFNDKQLTGGSIYAPFLIVNGTVDQVLAGKISDVYFPYLGANPDKVDHVRLLGNNIFGFEDLRGGGDRDFNDFIVRANLSL